ncbi:hypothetical protein PR048_015375 [Dryococelus australis]|uniref:Uncharacterized protein n=1 Tax=Dryococelus australis TaxID=614101 RepID=A0ABQ9HGS7_9NEOP|nr:hypothetical protein PR048_015375 [Dryococelus australis]
MIGQGKFNTGCQYGRNGVLAANIADTAFWLPRWWKQDGDTCRHVGSSIPEPPALARTNAKSYYSLPPRPRLVSRAQGEWIDELRQQVPSPLPLFQHKLPFYIQHRRGFMVTAAEITFHRLRESTCRVSSCRADNKTSPPCSRCKAPFTLSAFTLKEKILQCESPLRKRVTIALALMVEANNSRAAAEEMTINVTHNNGAAGDVAVRLLASHQGETSSIPSGVAPESSHVGTVPYDAAGRRGFLGISHSPPPPIPALLHTHLASTSSALEITISAERRRGPRTQQWASGSEELVGSLLTGAARALAPRPFIPLAPMKTLFVAKLRKKNKGKKEERNRIPALERRNSARARPSGALRSIHQAVRRLCAWLQGLLVIDNNYPVLRHQPVNLSSATDVTSLIPRTLKVNTPNTPTSGVHMRKSGRDPAGNRTRFAYVGSEQSNHYIENTSCAVVILVPKFSCFLANSSNRNNVVPCLFDRSGTFARAEFGMHPSFMYLRTCSVRDCNPTRHRGRFTERPTPNQRLSVVAPQGPPHCSTSCVRCTVIPQLLLATSVPSQDEHCHRVSCTLRKAFTTSLPGTGTHEYVLQANSDTVLVTTARRRGYLVDSQPWWTLLRHCDARAWNLKKIVASVKVGRQSNALRIEATRRVMSVPELPVSIPRFLALVIQDTSNIPPSALMHSRLHSSVSHPLVHSSHEHLTRRRPAISSRRPQLTPLVHTHQTTSIKYCQPLGCGSRHLESSPTHVMRRGGPRRQPDSPEQSCVVKRIGNSSRREEVCDAIKSRRCRHSQDSQKGADSQERIVPGRGEDEVGLRLRREAAESAPAAAHNNIFSSHFPT